MKSVISAITVIGLSIGLAACIFIALFVIDELSYDKYNKKADRIYRIAADLRINGGSINDVNTPPGMAPALVKDFPEIEKAVRIRQFRRDIAVHIGEKSFLQSQVVLADSSLFDIFTLPFIEGDPKTALTEPNALVLSATTAKRYFNSTADIVGRTLRLDEDTALYVVRGVMEDMPAQSHVHFQMIRSIQQKRTDWINLFAATYILTRPNTSTARVDQILTQEVARYLYPEIEEQLHNTQADLKRNGDHFRYYAIPLTRIHLYSSLNAEFEPNGNSSYVFLFSLVAALILIVACINFVNLTIAGGIKRSRHAGIRKLLGASRRRLVTRFLGESLLSTGIAMLLALLIVLVMLPSFNALSGKHFDASILFSPYTILLVLITTLITGLLAGLYPALLLSRVDPLKVLRGHLGLGLRAGGLRTVLLVIQFSVAMVLLISTAVIYSQLYYIRHRELGYDREQLLTVKDTRSLGDEVWTFANEAKRIPGVTGVTVSGFLPNRPVTMRGFFKDRSASVSSTVLLGDWQIDASYLRTLKIQLSAGRDFSPNLPTDSACVLINETAARMLGHAHPLGERIYTADDTTTGYRIIGVVKDFNTASLKSPIDPVVFRLSRDGSAVSFRIAPQNIERTVQSIQAAYQAVSNHHPFTYTFLDDDFNNLYAADQKIGSLCTVFALLAVIIAGLGIFGLVTVAAQQRTREMGIRRILGARMLHLATLLLKDYGVALILSMLIALPTGAWAMHRWLEEFAYRTDLHPWIFITAPLITIIMAVSIVSIKAARSARVNPAVTLRVE